MLWSCMLLFAAAAAAVDTVCASYFSFAAAEELLDLLAGLHAAGVPPQDKKRTMEGKAQPGMLLDLFMH